MRRSAGPALWDQFEYLARISQEWIDCHPDGDYPKGVAHMPVLDEWLEEDRRLAGSNGAVSAQEVFSLQRSE
jgi:hypothetical protein